MALRITMKPLSSFLGRFSLRTGAIVIGIMMSVIFLVVAVAGIVLLSLWEDIYSFLTDVLGSNPNTDRNEMLDSVYPVSLSVAVTLFLSYALSGVILLVGIRMHNLALVKVFLFATVGTILLCLMGHAFIFTRFTWYHQSQLIVTITFNAFWYIWWFYSLLICISFYSEEAANSS